ncbi:MAG: carboxylating nicotinate-nucleotide diphosphorylase [Desulfobacterales bacterium]
MTHPFEIPVSRAVDQLIELAIAEDIGHGDITTEPLGLGHAAGQARIVANEPLVIAGLDAVRRVYEKFGCNISFQARVEEGGWVAPQDVVAELKSDMQSLLLGERIALNFLQRISGIATHVRTYVDTLPKSAIRLTDTRKTVPGWRMLEKYAVRVGGAYNHRMGLYDGVLIKDNHIAACGGIALAVQRVRSRVSHLIRIEVETENLRQVEAALAEGADVIMLDNMSSEMIAQAVEIIGGRAAVEVSGRVDRQQLEQLSSLGVDVISSGALTHAARFVDLSMHMAPLK